MVYAAGRNSSSFAIGQTSPAHISSVGQVIIASLPEKRWPDFLAGPTPVDARSLSAEDVFRELRNVRKRGVAWNKTHDDFWSVATKLELKSQVMLTGCSILVKPEDCGPGKEALYEAQIKRLGKLLSDAAWPRLAASINKGSNLHRNCDMLSEHEHPCADYRKTAAVVADS